MWNQEPGTLSTPAHDTCPRDPSHCPGPTWSLIKRPLPTHRSPDSWVRPQTTTYWISPSPQHTSASRRTSNLQILVVRSVCVWVSVVCVCVCICQVQCAEQGCSNPYHVPPIGSRLGLRRMGLLPYCKTQPMDERTLAIRNHGARKCSEPDGKIHPIDSDDMSWNEMKWTEWHWMKHYLSDQAFDSS